MPDRETPLSATVLGEGRPIVLLPGFALDSSVMAAACEPAFSTTTGWQRIYLDLPGTGGSPAGEPTAEAVLAAVRATVDALVGDAPYLVAGHSFGGYLATGLARRDPRVAGLLLICCGMRIGPADRDRSGVLPSTPEPGWLDGVPPDLQQHFEQAIGHQTRAVAERIAAVLARRGPIDDAYLDALRPAGYRLADEPGPPGADPDDADPDDAHRDDADPGAAGGPDFAGRVRLLAGRRDRIAGYRDPFAALDRYPDGSLTVLAAAGHYLPFEQPESFAAAVLDWLTPPAPAREG